MKAWRLAVVGLCILPLLPRGAVGADEKREPIGAVLGKPVYRDEIDRDRDLRGELHRLFTRPVLDKYVAAHQEELEPTKEEIDAMAKSFADSKAERLKKDEPELIKRQAEIEQRLQQPDLAEKERSKLETELRIIEIRRRPTPREFLQMFVKQWKLQKHLYDKYGGGRILWQQFGIEAFDAMHKWLQAQEEAKEFTISDPSLRKMFYAYWTTHNHGSFLWSDKEAIRREFLEPKWREGLVEKAAKPK